MPTDGRLTSINFDYGAGGDAQYLRANLKFQQYIPISKQIHLRIQCRLRLGQGGGRQSLPDLQELLRRRSGQRARLRAELIGPDRRDIGAYIGGNRKFNANSELYLPVPGTGNDRTLAAFPLSRRRQCLGRKRIADLREPAFVRPVSGMTWVSPVGPLKISYGSPIRKKPTDRIQHLQFQIGTAF